MKRINRFIFDFKEIFWDNLKNLIIFFSFIMVMLELVLPNAGPFFGKFFGVLIILIAISFILDEFYYSEIIKPPKKLNKKPIRKHEKNK